jgi:predicted nucleic acid-binding protein
VIHLDTSFLIRALVRSSPQDRRLRQWLGAGEKLGISAIGWAEFLCGPLEAEALLAARLFNASGRRRGTLVDCMIAATAIRHGALLATADEKDFRRFIAAGLTLAGA